MRKLFSLFLFLFISSIVCGQNAISLKRSDAKFSEIIQSLEAHFKVTFAFTSDIIPEQRIDLNLEKKTLDQVLETIFAERHIHYAYHGDDYIVLTKEERAERTICGRLVNKYDEPLAYANVFIPELGKVTSSNVSGHFEWSLPLYENDAIEISYIGYETQYRKATDLMSCPIIRLDMQRFSFSEVLVKDYVTSGIEQSPELDHFVLRPDKINMVPGLTDADVLQMVQLLPGIQSIDESATSIHIRGGSPDQNLILYDGIPIYNRGHFFGMVSAFNPSLVDQIKVYKSGFGPNFGGRTSGVIDINSDQRIPDKLAIDAGVNFTHGDISIKLPMFQQKSALFLGGRNSYTHIVETPTYQKLSQRVFRKGKLDEVIEEDEEYDIDFTLGFEFNDFNAKYLIQPDRHNTISFNYFRFSDKLDFNFKDFSDQFETVDNLDLSSSGLGANWQKKWNPRFQSNVNISTTSMKNNYQFKIKDLNDEFLETETEQLNNIEDRTVNLSNSWNPRENMNLEFGLQYADLHIRRKWQFDEEEIEEVEDNNEISSAYASLNNSIENKLKTKIGLRVNYANSEKTLFYEPRFSLLYFPSTQFQIKASAGLYHQFINQVIEFNDLGLNQHFWVLADEKEDTPISNSQNFTLGFILNQSNIIFELEGYYKKHNGLISNLSEFQINMDGEFDQGVGNSYGIDCLLKKRWPNYQAWISYSYGRTRYTFDLEDEILEMDAPHDRPHTFSFMSQLNFDKLFLSLGWKIASGNLYTAAIGLEDDGEEPDPLYEFDDINAYRLPVYHRLDLSFMYQVAERKNGFSAKLGFSVLNMYDRENLLSREYFSIYDEDTERYELQARDRAMLRFTPNIVLRIGYN